MKVKQLSSDHFIISDIIYRRLVEKEFLYYSRSESIELFSDEHKDFYIQKEEEILDINDIVDEYN